jgi:hypothetical protein
MAVPACPERLINGGLCKQRLHDRAAPVISAIRAFRQADTDNQRYLLSCGPIIALAEIRLTASGLIVDMPGRIRTWTL